jgi:hypothetical protein
MALGEVIGVRSPDALLELTPYIAAWSEEQPPRLTLVERHGRIGYQREALFDRDRHGVLWPRMPLRPGRGRPDFARMHPLRQRRAMAELLCQVCAQPADRNDDGVLWLLPDRRGDWPGWPVGAAVQEPPVCLLCALVSLRYCPALRDGAVAVRVRTSQVTGVFGTIYRAGPLRPVAVDVETVRYDDPRLPWVQAERLVRELGECSINPPEALADLTV